MSRIYSVKETYVTLQGEGAQTGRRAVFLRFAGCNLWSGLERDRAKAVCSFCDTDFVGTDGPGGGKFESPDALAEHVLGLSVLARQRVCGFFPKRFASLRSVVLPAMVSTVPTLIDLCRAPSVPVFTGWAHSRLTLGMIVPRDPWTSCFLTPDPES